MISSVFFIAVDKRRSFSSGCWSPMQHARFLATATPDQRDALKRDLEPVVEIYRQL